MACTIQTLIGIKFVPNWTKHFPVIGQGTLVFSIQRHSPFFIVIRPKPPVLVDEWISLTVGKDEAFFTLFRKGEARELTRITGKVKNEFAGYEENRKISYWFSYDRSNLVIKYGKGYRMEETTLMTHDFLKDKKHPEKVRKDLENFFSPDVRRLIEQYDIESREVMIYRMYTDIIEIQGKSIASSPEIVQNEVMDLSKSLIDIEREVSFDRNPFVCNWSPFVLDSSKLSLYELDSNDHTFSASLPPTCRELYSNVNAQNVDLDWCPEKRKCKLSDAIRFSLESPNGALNKKLKSKKKEFGSIEQTYLRVTLGSNRGNSPGIPYVLEIWPKDHGSPIHNHGNSYAIIKVLYGEELKIEVFNKHVDKTNAIPIRNFQVKKGDVTWISPNWFQTHKLWNHSNDFIATVQCYQFGQNDHTEWPYFDYVSDTNEIDEFLPNSDYDFKEMVKIVMNEYCEHD